MLMSAKAKEKLEAAKITPRFIEFFGAFTKDAQRVLQLLKTFPAERGLEAVGKFFEKYPRPEWEKLSKPK